MTGDVNALDLLLNPTLRLLCSYQETAIAIGSFALLKYPSKFD